MNKQQQQQQTFIRMKKQSKVKKVVDYCKNINSAKVASLRREFRSNKETEHNNTRVKITNKRVKKTVENFNNFNPEYPRCVLSRRDFTQCIKESRTDQVFCANCFNSPFVKENLPKLRFNTIYDSDDESDDETEDEEETIQDRNFIDDQADGSMDEDLNEDYIPPKYDPMEVEEDDSDFKHIDEEMKSMDLSSKIKLEKEEQRISDQN